MKIRTATTRDANKLANLIHFEVYVHRHLDWRQPLDWIGKNPFLVLEKNGEIIAALVCPPDPPSVSWVRLFAMTSSQERMPIWELLWNEAINQLRDNAGVKWLAAMPLHSWMQSLLIHSGFINKYNVLMLSWENRGISAEKLKSPVNIRSMRHDDITAIRKIDKLAFEPVWQNSIDILTLAYQQSSVSTVIKINQEIVGYQISTSTAIGAHLARLAIHPDFQGAGLGYTLLRDLLNRFADNRVNRVTVNTQKDNIHAMSLYSKAGFSPTGEEYPFYQFCL
ncbi:MAG: GNAT family N-acetyltransferase [Anaerolineales bacterium]